MPLSGALIVEAVVEANRYTQKSFETVEIIRGLIKRHLESEKTYLSLTSVSFASRKKGAQRQKPGDRQRLDDATKESSHVQILWEAEGWDKR